MFKKNMFLMLNKLEINDANFSKEGNMKKNSQKKTHFNYESIINPFATHITFQSHFLFKKKKVL